jgi:adenosine/AMP kinase
MELKTVRIENPNELNFILGQSHFIKTVEDIHEALVTAVPGIQFGLAFCESSGAALVRASGTSPELVELAKRNALALSAGHSFIVFPKWSTFIVRPPTRSRSSSRKPTRGAAFSA